MPGEQPGPDVPSIARMWDYLLGGKDYFAADEAAAKAVEDLFPGTELIAVRSRRFLARAVTWLARQGVGQFLDLGSGIPTRGRIVPVHETAREILPHARVVYADIDEIAAAHASVTAAGPGTAAIRADVTDSGAVLGDPAVRRLIDLREPAGLIFGMILHFMTAPQARGLVAAYAGAAAPGSYVVISVARNDDDTVFRQVRDLVRRSGMDLHNHSPQVIRSFFRGLDVVPPGVVPVRSWCPGWRERLAPDSTAYALGGVGRVPPRFTSAPARRWSGPAGR